jgi:outer membrane immunogenic protein
MRTLLLSATALLGLGFAAQAADMPAYPAEEAVVTPAGYDWTGFYVGVHGGYGWAESELSSPEPEVLDPTVDNDEVEPDGWIGGGQAGFNFQAGSFVFGIEGDIAATGIDGEVTIDPTGPDPDTVLNTEINWIATVRGRVGLAFESFLPYVTGGFAIADVDVGATDLPFALPDFDESETFSGWTVGGGVEFGFSENVSAKIEYLYMDLDEETFVLTDEVEGAEVTGTLEVQTIKAGLNFRF